MARLQPRILRFNSLSSTNTEAARQAAAGAEEGLCIIAKEQTAGRGRLERTWVSPMGAGLYFSIVLRPSIHPAGWPLIPLMAALSVHDALRQTGTLEADIKWPNDILVGGRKLCGILCETIETDTGRAAIVGIGINLTSEAFPAGVRAVATSIQEVGAVLDAEALLQSLIGSLVSRYESFQAADGANVIRSEWSARSSFANGKRVRITNGEAIIEGTTGGLESDGALRVETDAGEIKIVRAGDVTSVRCESS